MNIAFYFTSEINPNVGGTERVTYAVANQLKACGVDYIYISFKGRKTISFDDRYQYYLPNDNVLICNENIDFVINLLKEKQIDVLINQDSFETGNEFCTNSYFPNVKCITVIHYNLFGSCTHVGDLIKEQYLTGLSSPLKYVIQKLLLPYYKNKARTLRVNSLRKIYSAANHIVVLSESDKKDYPVEDKSHLHVISNPITLSPPDNFPSKEKRALYVGRMVFSPKRVDYLLRAWKIVEKAHPDWSLDLLGEGSCLGYYKSLANELELKKATFHGNQPPSEFYKRASIFCMTSTFEGFGLVLTEAMQAGTIPIAFRSFEAVTDIIENGVDGVLVQPFDIKEYAKKIVQLIEDEELRARMSKVAQKKVNKFDVEKKGQDWIHLLNTICQ